MDDSTDCSKQGKHGPTEIRLQETLIVSECPFIFSLLLLNVFIAQVLYFAVAMRTTITRKGSQRSQIGTPFQVC